MKNFLILALVAVCFIVGCVAKAPEPVSIEIEYRKVDYLADVKPILDQRCVVCHSCYNSPCQLKMSSYEGLDRGASKKAIYNATRLKTMDPTRLFIDAETTEGWREKDFFSVTGNTATVGFNNSIMLQLLDHKMKNPKSSGDYFAESDKQSCVESGAELGKYLEEHPNQGMPFGFPPLKQKEFETIALWLSQGANGPSSTEQEKLTTPKSQDAQAIERWETFLNTPDAKHGMTARYLYEHLFLAHLTFKTGSDDYFELVRSKSAPGEPIQLIATVRPYDDPGVKQFYYRFRKIHSTIVHKTHMVFPMDDAQLKRFDELFIQPQWLQNPHLVGYNPTVSANPFRSFEQIPPRSRYQFLLDNAQYTIMTFIRGPVCRGQVALNVIHDQFWVMFLDPDHDLSVKYPGFLKQQSYNLRTPNANGSDFGNFNIFKDEYRKAADRFAEAQQAYTASHNYGGLDYDAIWKGNRAEDTPLLTVYRHFDSASVHKGLLGGLPETMWVIDYPLLERIYYALVAGFDVYGTLSHQLATRLYMDTLRLEGESLFLNFMPRQKRKPMLDTWYTGVKEKHIHYFPADMPSGIKFTTEDPKREFIETLVKQHIRPEVGIEFDKANYLAAGEEYPQLPESYKTDDDYLQGFRAISKPGTAFFKAITDNQFNLAYVRIRSPKGKDFVFTIVVNRWHDSVAFPFSEDKTFEHEKDQANFIKGFVGSYPNIFMDLSVEEVPEFFALIDGYTGSEAEIAQMRTYLVNRANDDFWERYDWLQQRFKEDQPVQSGLFDLNRYYYRALVDE
jgi:hypothetical protein